MSNVKTTVKGRFIGGGLFEPKEQESGKLRHSACVVLDEDEDKKIEAIIKAAKEEKWGSKKVPGLTVWGVREGDDPEFEHSYEMNFINPKSSRPPKTLARHDGVLQAVTKEDDVIYPGCYVAVSVDAYAMDANKDKNMKATISLNLRGVMFVRDGERLGDVVKAEEEFEGFESEESANDDIFGDEADVA